MGGKQTVLISIDMAEEAASFFADAASQAGTEYGRRHYLELWREISRAIEASPELTP